jgi:site-specific DNA-methyltransferase (adenine-specific)
MKHERKNSVVHLMDCIEGMKQYPDKWFDLAIVDPPYGINADREHKEGHGWVRREKKGWDKDSPNFDYWHELFRVSENQIIWGANHFLHKISEAKKNISSPCWLIWDKGQREFSLADAELAWTSLNKSVRVFELSRGAHTNLKKQTGGGWHSTEKPVALYDWIFHNYAKPDFKILDTHLGSQSSRIAAHKHGLDFTGFELDAEYFEKGNKRFDDYISQTTIFDML